MIKALAVVRTVFFIFILGYAVSMILPRYFGSMTHTLDEQYARCVDTAGFMLRALGFAVAWIALETLFGWWMALRKGKNMAVPAPQKP
jgi:hypothetical protein